MAQFKLLFHSWPVETPSLQVRLFPSSSFALRTKAAVFSEGLYISYQLDALIIIYS